MKYLIQLIKFDFASQILNTAIAFLSSNSDEVWEEALNLVIIVLLISKQENFDHKFLINWISPLLKDQNPKIKFVAWEALLTILLFTSKFASKEAALNILK